MGGISLSIHPLFFLLGIYYALTDRIFVFIIYAITAVIHECGHSVAAGRRGYRLNKITLTPFGAMISGDINGLKFKDEAAIAVAGPIVNLAVGLLFVAGWWIFPETYAFTDIAAEANFSLAAVNFIPVYPLDGGRVVFAAISERAGEKKALKICKVIGVTFSLLLFIMFIITCFGKPNLSLLIFSSFTLIGTFSAKKENGYVKVYSSFNRENLSRGMPVKRQAVDKSVSVKTVISLMDGNALNEIEVYDNENAVAVIKQKRLSEIIEKADIYSPIGKYLT